MIRTKNNDTKINISDTALRICNPDKVGKIRSDRFKCPSAPKHATDNHLRKYR